MAAGGDVIRLSGHPFVRRAAGKDLLAATGEVRRRLEVGRPVCVFLEGTTTGGDRILPFKPTLLQAAIEIGAPITPVALRWSAPDPGVIVSEDVAYWKDHVFAPHIWRVAGLRGLRIDIHFGPPLQSPPTSAVETWPSVYAANRYAWRAYPINDGASRSASRTCC